VKPLRWNQEELFQNESKQNIDEQRNRGQNTAGRLPGIYNLQNQQFNLDASTETNRIHSSASAHLAGLIRISFPKFLVEGNQSGLGLTPQTQRLGDSTALVNCDMASKAESRLSRRFRTTYFHYDS